ncbi:hypothetical protein CLOM_g22506 [Closterium sp. NIES-68]|nr:hypothetical protein CLOM_g22506 [Closterium sp. NIES-68]GJP59469.1 hypothetical protein CLOP_g12261 [Closterium sp. NIES-67]
MAAANTTKIYGLKISTCTKRVLTALEEKNVTGYEVVTVDVSKGEHKSAEFKKKQPFGLIPKLEDDQVELFESRAIARYVAERYADQGTNLLGPTLKERALVNQWLEVESQNYTPPIFGLLTEKVYKLRRGLTTDEAKAAEHKAKVSVPGRPVHSVWPVAMLVFVVAFITPVPLSSSANPHLPFLFLLSAQPCR